MTYPQPPQDPGGRYGHPEQSGYGPVPPGYGPPQQQGHGQQQGGYAQDPYGGQQYWPGSYPGAAPGHPAWGPPQGGWGYGPEGPSRRPGTVLAAAIMTYVGSGLLILLGLLFLIGSAIPAFRQGVAEGAAMATVPAGVLVIGGIVLALVGIGTVVLAVFAQRGRNGARIALTVVGGLFLVLQLFSIVGGAFQGLIGFVWIAVGITLFWVGDANAWYRQARA